MNYCSKEQIFGIGPAWATYCNKPGNSFSSRISLAKQSLLSEPVPQRELEKQKKFTIRLGMRFSSDNHINS